MTEFRRYVPVVRQPDLLAEFERHEDPDLVLSTYWSTSVARYLQGLPAFVEGDDDLPDPIV